jgi:lysozyme
MSQIIAILNFEEGYKENPYIDSLGYPTVGVGIRIGPKGNSLSSYTFRVPKKVSDVWTQSMVDLKLAEMNSRAAIAAALKQCNPARADVLTSMCYQLGADGLAKFKKSLVYISNGDFTRGGNEMLDSLWARQTPARARRHAEVMRTGTYDAYKGLI